MHAFLLLLFVVVAVTQAFLSSVPVRSSTLRSRSLTTAMVTIEAPTTITHSEEPFRPRNNDGNNDEKKVEEKKAARVEKPNEPGESSLETDFGLFVENSLNTVEDIVLHARRAFLSEYKDESPRVDPLGLAFSSPLRRKKRVVVVGSGWAAHAFMKICETDGYDVVCVSPRPFFVFTPMLASTAVGAVEYRSIVEPVRVANPLVTYVEAEMTDIDVDRKKIIVTSQLRPDEELPISYDYLVYAAGCKVNNMGLKEVDEYCVNLKEVEDVKAIKSQIMDTFEKAVIPSPQNNEETLRKMLSFAIVGGGPVGVEFTGGLCDFITTELLRLYPFVAKYVTINLISSTTGVLNVFDALLQEKALESLKEQGINVMTNSWVTRVAKNKLYYRVKNSGVGASTGSDVSEAPEERELDFGMCLWAAGTAPRLLTKVLAERCGEVQQKAVARTGRLSIDQWMRVEGLSKVAVMPVVVVVARGSDCDCPPSPPYLTLTNHTPISRLCFILYSPSPHLLTPTYHHQESFGSIFAMGDAAVCSVTVPNEGPLPQTAQVSANNCL